ncbi:MAG: 16S rRNA (guanine(527)-N(7))-methyltransferase RsmG [Deltaproteobacteria bacterium]|nr:16S rRNA (guanine(527)-N(7))-methyltransferase RsmG [Deltaproteobacteria bacterium]
MFSPEQKLKLLEGAKKLGLSFDERFVPKLSSLVENLLEWNHQINLTAITEIDEVIEKHLIDSLALLPYLLPGSLMDVGSGAGFPGLPLAIVQPEREFILVEATKKKVNFISEMITRLELNNCRSIWSHLPDKKITTKVDQIVSRGTFKVADFLKAALPSLAPRGQLILMKGKIPESELILAIDLIKKYRLVETRLIYQLPYSKADRSLFVWKKPV